MRTVGQAFGAVKVRGVIFFFLLIQLKMSFEDINIAMPISWVSLGPWMMRYKAEGMYDLQRKSMELFSNIGAILWSYR